MEEFKASRVDGLMPSGIRMITRLCDEVNGINLGQGVCDEPTPQSIKDAAINAILSDKNVYSKFEGIDALRGKIAEKMKRYNNINCDPETEVTVNAGATGGFVATCLSFINPGDEVILFEPFYGYHLNILRLCKADIKYIKMTPPDWGFDFDKLKDMVSDKTKAILINTPCNPTGKVFSRAELEFISALCQKHRILAIADEMYEYILYDDNKHISIGSVPGMEDFTITISGFSKTYNITGWRLGYTVAKKGFTEKIGVLNDLVYICAATPLQHAMLAAFELPDSYFSDLRESYNKRLNLIFPVLESVGFKVYRPEGAYYLLADVSSMGLDDNTDAAQKLLELTGVGAVPGVSFYSDPKDGKTQLRFCFSKDYEVVEEACERLKKLISMKGVY